LLLVCCAVLLEPRFYSFFFSKVSKKLMGNFDVALRVNGVFEESGPNNRKARYCIPQSNTDRVKESFMVSMGIFRRAHTNILEIHKTSKTQSKLMCKKEV
jgi:hypothetical protein